MTILYLLIPISLIFVSIAVWAFFWAVKNHQFDDLEGPAYSILFDEDENDLTPEERERRRHNAAEAARKRRQDESRNKGEDTDNDDSEDRGGSENP